MSSSQGAGRSMGRGRGRSAVGRGRGRGQAAPRPGGAAGAPPAAAAPAPQPVAAPAVATPVAAVTAQMAQASIQPQAAPAAASSAPMPVPVGTGAAMAPAAAQGQAGARARRGYAILPEAENFVPQCKENMASRMGTLEGSEKIDLVANSFLLQLGKDGKGDAVYNYRVHCNKNLAPSVLSGIVHNTDSITSVVGRIAFDGMQAFLLDQLPEEETSFPVRTRGSKDGKIGPEDVVITFKFNHRVPWGSPTILQVMNILLKSYMKKAGMTLIGRHYFQPHRVHSVQGLDGINVWPGYTTAISECSGGVMLNVDIAHKITRNQNAMDVIREAARSHDVKETSEKGLVGEVVMTRYNNKTYRVDDIDWNASPLSKFKAGRKLDDKTFEEYETTYIQYYQEKYQIAIRDHKQPMLVSRNKEKGPIPANNPEAEHGAQKLIYLVPELCSLTGITERQRADFNFMKELGKVTRVGPNDRARLTLEYPHDINKKPDCHRFDNWSVNVTTDFVRPAGRRLKRVSMFQSVDWVKKSRGAELKSNQDNPDWTTSMRSQKLARIPTEGLQHWLFIFPERVTREAQDFHSTLIRVAGPMGLNIAHAELQRIPRDQPNAYQEVILAKLREKPYQLLCCMLPNNQKQRYDIIKKLSYCGQNPIPSQCVISKTVSGKKCMSACTKIAMQINAKLGGALWHPEPYGPFANCMTIGLDVFHQKGQNSILGYVAALNQTQDRFYSRAMTQTERGENMIKLHEPTVNALKRYKAVNGDKFPRNIIVFRDGVGDGQLPLVRNAECAQIKEAIAATVPPGTTIGLCFVVVQKRVNHRFYLFNRGNFANPLPGTVVDDQVTRKKWCDFFLCSQSVNQGTVSPTHFNVIYDDCDGGTGIKADAIQRYSYIQTHLYYNWPGTIRVPAQCQYAHKLAYLVGEHTVSLPSEQLSDKLFYL